jgi:3D (Asp-Asp-Asp) domain-containing protein
MRSTKTRSAFVNLKPVFVVFFLMAIIGVPGYFVGTGYANDNSKAANQWETVKMRVTAYCPCPKCCGNYSDGVTASGHKINPGDLFVAADKSYPFGTEMIIPGYKNSDPVKVLDRGGVIQGTRLDVFFDTHQKALEWGVKYLDVIIRYQ